LLLEDQSQQLTLRKYFKFSNTKFDSNYLRWVVLHEVVDYLAAAFRHENFNFFGKVIDGSKAERARTDICIDSTDESIGFLLSQYYVNAVFPAESKQIAKKLIEDVETSVKITLNQSEWMESVTKQKALVKLSLFTEMIGYPDNWPKYEFSISANNYFNNKLAARSYSYNETVSKPGKPVDHSEWEMTPETVNAYYEPTLNDIVFPAAILQAPFFDKMYPSSMNYGAIGMVMSHEAYHGFDDQGRLYDGHGKLENWWTSQDAVRFQARAKCLVDQYNGFSPLPGYHVNGNLTLGENIADNAGMKNAFMTYNRVAGPDAKKESILKGFTNQQLFFIAYGQLWCTKARDEVVKQRLLTDPHSPGKFRVVGPLQNLQGFADTYNCPAGSTMNPQNKCVLF
jgi:putative endopeptidase